MGIGKPYGRSQVAELQVFDEFMIAGKSSRRAGEFGSVVPIEQFADGAPFITPLDDRVADSQQSGRFGVPQPRGCEAASGLQVKVEPGRVYVFAAMREAHGEVCFVGTLVGGKSGIAVYAKQRSAGAARIGEQIGRDLVQPSGEIGNKLNRGSMGAGEVFLLVRLEPLALVVPLEAREEAEEVGSEVRGHDRQKYGETAGNVKDPGVLSRESRVARRDELGGGLRPEVRSLTSERPRSLCSLGGRMRSPLHQRKEKGFCVRPYKLGGGTIWTIRVLWRCACRISPDVSS